MHTGHFAAELVVPAVIGVTSGGSEVSDCPLYLEQRPGANVVITLTSSKIGHVPEAAVTCHSLPHENSRTVAPTAVRWWNGAGQRC